MKPSDIIALVALVVSFVLAVWTIFWSIHQAIGLRKSNLKTDKIKSQYNHEFKSFSDNMHKDLVQYTETMSAFMDNISGNNHNESGNKIVVYYGDNKKNYDDGKLTIEVKSVIDHIKNIDKQRKKKW